MNAITGRRGLYAILDPDFCRGRDPFAVAEAILEGGCAVLQLRAKRGADDDWIALAHALQARCARADVPFVVNDRVELALRTGAAGLHLGQTDMPIEQARDNLQRHVQPKRGFFSAMWPTIRSGNPSPVTSAKVGDAHVKQIGLEHGRVQTVAKDREF